MISRPFDLSGRTLVISLAQGAARGVNVLIAVVLVRVLDRNEWASVALLLTIYTAATALGTLNLQQGIFYFLGRVGRAGRRAFAVQTTMLLGAAGFVTAVIVAGLDPLLRDSPYQLEGALVILALVLLLELPTTGAPQLLLAAERATASGLFTGIMSVLQAAALTVPLLMGYGLITAMWSLTAYAAVRLVTYVGILLLTTPPGSLRPDFQLIREQIVYTAPLSLSIAAGALTRHLSKWFVAAFDAPAFGAYAIAANEIPVIPIIPYAAGAVLATRVVHAMAAGRPHHVLAYWHASVARVATVVLPATVIIIVAAPELVRLLFTNRYAAAVIPFQIHTLILLHRVGEYGLILRSSGDTRSLWRASLVLLAGTAMFSAPLTLAGGMVGAAAGVLVAAAVAWFYILHRIARVLDVTVRQVFPWGLYGRTLLVAMVAAGVALMAATAAADLLPRLLLKIAVFLLVFWIGYQWLGMRGRIPRVPDDDPAFTNQD